MTDYHDAHDAYIGAVAAALTTAGFEPLDWWGDANDPRDGWIELRPVGAYASSDEVGLGWQEERGWHVLTVDKPDDGEDSRYVYDLLVGLVPSPSTVVHRFAVMAGVDVYVPDDGYPDPEFEAHSFMDDDPAFEAALAVYQ